MKKHVTTIILLIVLIVGLSLLLYPPLANWWNSMTQSKAVASYVESVADIDDDIFQGYGESIVICGSKTRHKRNVPIDNRAFYVKGCEQLCEIFYCDIYKR